MIQMIQEILKLNNITFNNIVEKQYDIYTKMFAVDEKYIIKLSQNNLKSLKTEIDFYKFSKLTFIPKYYASGVFDVYNYLIIENVKGVKLNKVWHSFSEQKRQSLMNQLAQMLKQFHEQQYLINDDVTWRKQIQNIISKDVVSLKLLKFNTLPIENFSVFQTMTIFNQSNMKLIYNNCTFDNIIYNDDILTLINFENICYASVDYELTKILMMMQNPQHYIQNNIKIFKVDYNNILKYIKKSYPQISQFRYIGKRLYVYCFLQNMEKYLKLKNRVELAKEIMSFNDYFDLNN